MKKKHVPFSTTFAAIWLDLGEKDIYILQIIMLISRHKIQQTHSRKPDSATCSDQRLVGCVEEHNLLPFLTKKIRSTFFLVTDIDFLSDLFSIASNDFQL